MSDKTSRATYFQISAILYSYDFRTRVLALRSKARAHGNDKMVAICDRALGGYEDSAWQAAKALAEAELN